MANPTTITQPLQHPDLLLTALQHQVIACLVQGIPVSKTAALLNVHRTTIHYWKRTSPDFADALRDAQEERAMNVRFASQQLAEEALQAVRDLLADPKTPPTVRLKAALHVLNQAAELPAPQPKHEAEAAQAARKAMYAENVPQPMSPMRAALYAEYEPEELERQQQEYEQACEVYLANKAASEQIVEEFHDNCDAQAELNDSLHLSTLFNTSTGF